MRHLICPLTLLLISAGVIVTALVFMEPLDSIIREKYGMPLEDLKPKCDKKDANLYNELVELQSQEVTIRTKLSGDLVAKAKEMGQLSNDEADQWIQDNCLTNANLINISKVAIDKAQICVEPNERLQGAEIDKAKQEFLQILCGAVSISGKWVYRNNLG